MAKRARFPFNPETLQSLVTLGLSDDQPTKITHTFPRRAVYLYMTLHFGAHAMQNSVKATVDSLRLPTFKAFEVKLPPTIEEQTAIAAVLYDMEAEIATLDARLTKSRQLKQGMMQELLSSRTRLLHEAPGSSQ